MPIVETGVIEFDAEGVAAGRLAFTTDVASAVVLLCVSMLKGADGRADL